MNNYTVVPNGLIVKNLPIEEKQPIKKIGISRRDLEQAVEIAFDSNTLPSREMRVFTGPEGARQLQQAIQAELRRPLTASEMIEQLDNLSREENV